MSYSGREHRSIFRATVGRCLVALAMSTAAFALPHAHAANPLVTAKMADLRGEPASGDVRHIADWVVVMAEGEVIAEGTPDTIGSNQAVIDAYLGSSHAALTEELITGHQPTEDDVEEGTRQDG